MMLRRVWLGAQLFIFLFYLSFGSFFVLISGPFRELTLLRLPFLNNYYLPGYAMSLVIFSLYGLYAFRTFKAAAFPMLVLTYSAFEMIANFPTLPRYGITLVIGIMGLLAFLIVRPKMNIRQPLPWFLLWLAFALAALAYFMQGSAIEFPYEAVIACWSASFFVPRGAT